MYHEIAKLDVASNSNPESCNQGLSLVGSYVPVPHVQISLFKITLIPSCIGDVYWDPQKEMFYGVFSMENR